jgi:hypothetical protein
MKSRPWVRVACVVLVLVLHGAALGWIHMQRVVQWPASAASPVPMFAQVDLLNPPTSRAAPPRVPPSDAARPRGAAPEVAPPEIAAPEIAAPKESAREGASPDIASPQVAPTEVDLPELASPEVAPTEVAPPDLASPEIAAPEPVAPEPTIAAPERPMADWPSGPSLRRFRVFFGDYGEGQSVARMTFQLEVAAPHYVLRAVGQAEGLLALVYSGSLNQESRGRVGPQGLQPERYEETRGSRRSRGVSLDHDAAVLRTEGGATVPMPSGTQDRLSVIYQLGLLARQQPERFIAGGTVELPVAGWREVRIERFEVMGPHDLIVQGRRVPALHLKRLPLGGERDATVQLWLGYDADLHPVRVRLEDARGQVLDQVIDEQ